MFELDQISQLVTLSADLSLSEIEKELNLEGYTLGFATPATAKGSKKSPTLREALQKRLPNLYALLYGELTDLCASLVLQRSEGDPIVNRLAPRQATGPNFKNLILGSGEYWGSFVQATLKVFYQPEKIVHQWVGFSTLEDSFRFERKLTRQEMFPRVFGRFSKNELKQYPRSLMGEYFLILEWVGPKAFLEALFRGMADLVEGRHPHRMVDHFKLQDFFYKLLRKKLPEVSWGGITLPASDDKALKAEKEILDILC